MQLWTRENVFQDPPELPEAENKSRLTNEQVAKSCVSHLAFNHWQLCKGLTTALSDCVGDGSWGLFFGLAVVPNPPLGNLGGGGADAGARAVQLVDLHRQLTHYCDLSTAILGSTANCCRLNAGPLTGQNINLMNRYKWPYKETNRWCL